MKSKRSSSTSPSCASLALAAFTALLMLASSAFAASTEKVIFNFTADYSNPAYSLTADQAGNLYGTAFDGTKYPNGAVFELLANQNGWTETPLFFFNGTNGGFPSTKLLLDRQGNIYGSTYQGGSSGFGVIFELSPSNGKWNYTILYNFQNGTDGQGPGNLIFDAAGNIFGTTSVSATSSGTVFGLKRPTGQNGSWTLHTLHTFNGTDGFAPNSLTFDRGNLYGTTAEGGSSSYAGTVFKLQHEGASWNYSLIYAFANGNDGAFPQSISSNQITGVLYGVTQTGGASNDGVVFAVTPDSEGGWTESVVYTFTGGTDGSGPVAPLTVGLDKLYGTTNSGGDASACTFLYPSPGCGVVFEIVPSTGMETVLHAFTGAPSDGAGPEGSGVIFDKGVLYGTTYYGGTGQCSDNGSVVGCGTVYSVNP